MRKLIISTAALAMLAAIPVGGVQLAQAATSAQECVDAFGAVAGNGGYWVYTPGETKLVYGTEVEFSGNSGNGFISVTEVTTPGTCIGYNKSDNQKGDEWVKPIGTAGETELDPLKVCQNAKGGGVAQTPESEPIGTFDCTP
jgi:hypothetical protein